MENTHKNDGNPSTESVGNENTKKAALAERAELQERLKTETNESVRYNIERRMGDLNQFVINVPETLLRYEEGLRDIAVRNRHSFCKRSDTQIELVRMMGDQVDSRFDVKEEDGEVECHYTFWVDGETEKSDTICSGVTDYDFLKEIERVTKQSNKDFDKALIDRDENPSEW